MPSAPRAEFYRRIDAANVDLKAFGEAFYRMVCVDHLGDVLDTLMCLRHDTNAWFAITTLVIPGCNDSDAEIAAECAWIRENLGVDIPLHFTAFHPVYKMRDIPPTPAATLIGHAGSRSPRGCSTPTRATCTTSRVGPHGARHAGWTWWSATGIRSGATRLPTTVPAAAADSGCRACTTARSGPGDPDGLPVSIA